RFVQSNLASLFTANEPVFVSRTLVSAIAASADFVVLVDARVASGVVLGRQAQGVAVNSAVLGIDSAFTTDGGSMTFIDSVVSCSAADCAAIELANGGGFQLSHVLLDVPEGAKLVETNFQDIAAAMDDPG